MDSTESFIARL